MILIQETEGQTLSSCAEALGVIFIPMGRLACLIFYAN